MAKLKEMENDAEAHEDAKLERLRDAGIRQKKEEQEELGRKANASEASFIQDMNKNLYSADGNEDLEGRLKKYQHYRQKGGDATSAETFMTR
jgi:hypothetical protein